ncbi:hypothetical protein MLD38_005149 [Melastoma candidum]|uniref:Uncharacterized protein n=1 Tax=Melastoma candidum TaxID=119954 RepID=A0ACB9SGJ5_9MYRT|nr:hypothetical protein MLD38_005149 [Melastoma candidum]
MPFVRVTAVVIEEYVVETRLIKENLTHFANEVKVRLSIDFVLLQTFEMTSFKAIKFMDSEVIAIHLSPTIFGRLGSSNEIGRFMNTVRRVSPVVVVFVDSKPRQHRERQRMVKEDRAVPDAAEDRGDSGVGGEEGVSPWREVFLGLGVSQFADFQEELLLGKVQVRGFRVVRRQGELVLCWHEL